MLLQIEGLRVAYGRIEALRGVDLVVNEGEIVTLLGANGAGKTTTLRTISGLLKPRSGAITFGGERIDGRPPHEIVTLGIGQAPEGRRIFPRMSVAENLTIGAYARRGDLTADVDRVYDLFPVLKERRSQAGGTLSGGEQQMLAIGRALMARPKLLLLDEPSMGLAPLIVARIFEILQEINAQGTTILLVEQNAAQALRLAARGYVLETGTIVLSDRADALLADDRVRSAYLGETVAESGTTTGADGKSVET
ncbi:MAG TPA: ABC transporter ATP-binding protein [Mycobacteriales bacterium]|nr:ABC transporter ATP-binding protein [Mycobacteriales bacterium]